MGERLQVFLIALVATTNGYVYQCVGAFHHQWCYRILPLRALRRFLTLLQARENAAVVRDELRGLCAWNVKQSGSAEPWRNPAIPCPFTVSLLSIAWTTDLEHQTYLSNYSFANGLIDAQKDCWHRASLRQNDVGICVIDITDIGSPAYCFVRHAGSPAQSAYQFLKEQTDLLDGPKSLKSPAEGTSDEKAANAVKADFINTLDAFWALVDLAGLPLVSASTLHEIWPDAARQRTGPKQIEVEDPEDSPMPLDIVVSLYLGFTDQSYLDTLKRIFGVSEAHQAVGKAILPPYEGGVEDMQRRTSVIRSLLAQQSAFEYLLKTRLKPTVWLFPAYTRNANVERAAYWTVVYTLSTGTTPPIPTVDPSPSGIRAWASTPLFWPLSTILRPGALIKEYLALYDPFPNKLLDALWFALQALGETTFMDLSCLCLSPNQVIKILRRSTEVEAVSLSGNPHIKAIHLPKIVASTPTLRRVHAMHLLDTAYPDLSALTRGYPPLFRQLEGVFSPQLLSCSHATSWTASFTFCHIAHVTTDNLTTVSIPTFTPAQVIQALLDILPVAFQENRYGESTPFWRKSMRLAPQMGPNLFTVPADGAPFYLASQMFLHATLSCGMRRPGQSWAERPIVNVPSDSLWHMSQAEGCGSWAFHFEWDHRRHRDPEPGRNRWGFICYDLKQRDGDTDSMDAPVEGGSTPSRVAAGAAASWSAAANPGAQNDTSSARATPRDATTQAPHTPPAAVETQSKLCVATVYDLRGFLRCMAAEGRPMPDAAAVERLERILDMRDPVTMEPICALMTQEDVPDWQAEMWTEERKRNTYTQKYDGLTTDRWATMFGPTMLPGGTVMLMN